MPFVTKKLAPSLGKNVCNQRCFKATSGSLYPVLVKRRIALQSPSAAKAPERTMNGGEIASAAAVELFDATRRRL